MKILKIRCIEFFKKKPAKKLKKASFKYSLEFLNLIQMY